MAQEVRHYFYIMHSKMSGRRCAFSCGTSTFLLIFGIMIIVLRTLFYNAIIKSAMTLRPNSATYDVWKINPIPMALKVHVFNWTNPEEIYNSTKKPRVKEMGPYTFTEVKQKVNITWNSNGTISYWHLKKWWFDPQSSKGSLYDAVTSVNPVALTAVHTTRKWNYFIQQLINVVIGSLTKGVSGTHTVGQILFEGYADPIINTVKSMSLGTVNMPFDKFGWFYKATISMKNTDWKQYLPPDLTKTTTSAPKRPMKRNGSDTYEGSFNMDTGEYGQIGNLYRWKYMSQTPYFADHCGAVGGSAGEFFSTDLTKDSIVKFFSPDLCRYVELEFVEEVIINGILGYKYAAGDRFLDNGTAVPENKCFCSGDCMPYGILDVSVCRYGSPAFVSLPHFHKADPYYKSLVDGLNATAEKHDFFMIFEPRTGLPLQVAARLQLNLLMQPIKGFKFFSMVPKVYFPILWFEQVVDIPSDFIFKIKILINFEMICLGLGIFSIWLAIMIKACCCYKICTSKVTREETEIKEREEIPLKEQTKKVLSNLTRKENNSLALKKSTEVIN